MMDWFIIGVIAVVVFALLKFRHVQHRLLIAFIIIVVLFFFTNVSNVIKENNINLRSFDGIVTMGKIYFNWFIHLGKNIANVAGYTVKMDWQGNVSDVVKARLK